MSAAQDMGARALSEARRNLTRSISDSKFLERGGYAYLGEHYIHGLGCVIVYPLAAATTVTYGANARYIYERQL
jgi:hypothetical protein